MQGRGVVKYLSPRIGFCLLDKILSNLAGFHPLTTVSGNTTAESVSPVIGRPASTPGLCPFRDRKVLSAGTGRLLVRPDRQSHWAPPGSSL